MTKNILLLFLSNVKTVGNKISTARYENVEGKSTQTTSESAFRYLLQKFPLDKIFIFASKRVRGEIVDADGKPQTHLEFTRARFKKFLPNADCYSEFEYDEDGSDDDNLKSIAQMAKLIQEYVAGVEGHKVTLHVDLTGGMRHVNMMMLELTRLLQYSGLTVGKVLYSNYKGPETPGTVEEIQNVYDLFQLIAGVEEFVNFGSVKALNSYYAERKLSEPLQKLCKSMDNFADAIKLCHYGQFREAIQNLHDAVHDFDKHEPQNVEDILMARLIGRIRENYHDLIAVRDKDDLRIIRWCLQNDYLQQALTLYTERIPEYLGEKIVSQSEAEAKRLSECVKRDKMGRNRFYILLTDYPPRKNHVDKAFRKFYDAVKSETVGRKSVDADAWLKSVNERLAPFNVSVQGETRLRAQVDAFNQIRQNPDVLNDLGAENLNPIREIVDELSDKLLAADKPFQRGKIIFDFVNKLPIEKFTNFFPRVVFAKDIAERFPRAYKVYEVLADDIFTVKIPQENFLSIMEKYFIIQNERNHSNHARTDFGKFTTSDSLRGFMLEALDEIKANLPAM